VNGEEVILEPSENLLMYNEMSANGDVNANGQALQADVADPDHLCDVCLPILGDDVVGTRPADRPDAVPTVHRRGCPHAQLALNRADASRDNPNGESASFGILSDQQIGNRKARDRTRERFASSANLSDQVPVTLWWSEDYILEYEKATFLAEIVVVASDRKLLLADCSEIVSELTEIVKTGSDTTNEHATLEFLVKIKDVDDLQNVMDRLHQVDSVMSVERRFGSELL